MSDRENISTVCGISHINDPGKFYERHSQELAEAGADAFGQPVDLFQPQVAERFAKSSMAQIMRHGQQIVGFALYNVIRGSHWRAAVDRGQGNPSGVPGQRHWQAGAI